MGFDIVADVDGALVELRLVTDRRTDRRTHDDSIFRASIASLGKNEGLPVMGN